MAKEQRDFPTTGHAEYNALQVSVWHGSKKVTIGIYPAIINKETGFTSVVITDGINAPLDVMPRLNSKKLEAIRQQAFKDIENKNEDSVVYALFKQKLIKHGMSLPNCEQCGKPNVLHKVKTADDNGLSSMMVCTPCDEKSQGIA